MKNAYRNTSPRAEAIRIKVRSLARLIGDKNASWLMRGILGIYAAPRLSLVPDEHLPTIAAALDYITDDQPTEEKLGLSYDDTPETVRAEMGGTENSTPEGTPVVEAPGKAVLDDPSGKEYAEVPGGEPAAPHRGDRRQKLRLGNSSREEQP